MMYSQFRTEPSLKYKFDHCSYKLVVFLACLMLLFWIFEGMNLSMHRFIDMNCALNLWQPQLRTYLIPGIIHKCRTKHSLLLFSCATSLHVDTHTKLHTICIQVINEDIIYRQSIAGSMQVVIFSLPHLASPSLPYLYCSDRLSRSSYFGDA